jgi:alpha-tubulin suppressor-like RCC1 family protein
MDGGAFHSAAVTKNGNLWTWGRGIFGQLGHGDLENRNKPKLVETALDVKFIQVSCGSDFTVALSDQGKVYTWGKGRQGALGHGDKNNHAKPKVVETLTDKIIVCVTAGSNFVIAVAGDGTVWSWGEATKGQLGYYDNKEVEVLPKMIKTFDKMKMVSASAGDYHVVALADNGKIYTWGSGQYGQLGHCNTSDQIVPRNVFFSQEDIKFVKVAASPSHTMALTEEGKLYTWGRNQFGQLGHDDTKDQYFPKLVDIQFVYFVDMAGGYFHSVAISDEGDIWTWGHGGNGRLGHGGTEDVKRPKLVELPDVDIKSAPRFKLVAAGDHHTLVITSARRIVSRDRSSTTTTSSGNKLKPGGSMRKKISRQKSLNASPRQISVPNIPKISLDAVRAAKTAGEMSVPKDASPRTPHSPLNSPISDQSDPRLQEEAITLKLAMQKLEDENGALKKQIEALTEQLKFIKDKQHITETSNQKLTDKVSNYETLNRLLKIDIEKHSKTIQEQKGKLDEKEALEAKAVEQAKEAEAKAAAEYIMLIEYSDVKRKLTLSQPSLTTEDLLKTVCELFKVAKVEEFNLEYFDEDFNEWVLLDTMNGLPKKLKLRLMPKVDRQSLLYSF